MRVDRCKRQSDTTLAKSAEGGNDLVERFHGSNHIDIIRQPHPEEPAKRASRRMAASPCRASILRDAVLRTAPQDEVGDFSHARKRRSSGHGDAAEYWIPASPERRRGIDEQSVDSISPKTALIVDWASEMPDFDVEAFVTKLDRLGVKLTAVPLADGKLRVSRWRMLNATEHAQQIEDLWTMQIGNDQERIDILAAHLANVAPRKGVDCVS